ncbi:uncharacterized protein [Macaca fascicularis]|uniref:uncharacterized protein n=1 Tax=Macaca fascicularis TaxID=9541 RepID=UPI0032B029BC
MDSIMLTLESFSPELYQDCHNPSSFLSDRPSLTLQILSSYKGAATRGQQNTQDSLNPLTQEHSAVSYEEGKRKNEFKYLAFEPSSNTGISSTTTERKLACFQLGYPDWKSARTVSFAPSFTILLVQVPQRRVGCVHMLICTYTMHRTRDLLCPSCVALGSKGKGESGEGEVIFHERLRLAGQQSLDGRTQFLALPLMVASFTKSLQEAASSRLSPEEETITVGEAPGNSGTSSRKKTGSKI